MRYDFINDNGEVIEREFPFWEVPGSITVEGCVYRRDIMGAIASCVTSVKNWNGVGRKPCSTWPRESNAMGVAESQVKDAMERDRKHGVPTEYSKTGNPILTGPGHEKDYMKLHGFHHRGGAMGADHARKKRMQE